MFNRNNKKKGSFRIEKQKKEYKKFVYRTQLVPFMKWPIKRFENNDRTCVLYHHIILPLIVWSMLSNISYFALFLFFFITYIEYE